MKLFELNSLLRKLRELRKKSENYGKNPRITEKRLENHFRTQEKLLIIVIVVYNDLDLLSSFQKIIPVSTTFTQDSHFRFPAVHPNSIFLKKRTYEKTLREPHVTYAYVEFIVIHCISTWTTWSNHYRQFNLPRPLIFL